MPLPVLPARVRGGLKCNTIQMLYAPLRPGAGRGCGRFQLTSAQVRLSSITEGSII